MYCDQVVHPQASKSSQSRQRNDFTKSSDQVLQTPSLCGLLSCEINIQAAVAAHICVSKYKDHICANEVVIQTLSQIVGNMILVETLLNYDPDWPFAYATYSCHNLQHPLPHSTLQPLIFNTFSHACAKLCPCKHTPLSSVSSSPSVMLCCWLQYGWKCHILNSLGTFLRVVYIITIYVLTFASYAT